MAVCCVGLLAVRSGGGVVEMLAVAPQAKGAAKAVNALLGVESTLKTTSLALAAADSRARAVVAATEQSLVEEKEATTKCCSSPAPLRQPASSPPSQFVKLHPIQM